MNETTNIAVETATAPIDVTRPDPGTSTRTEAAQSSTIWLDALAKPAFAIPLLTVFGALLFLLNLGGYPLYTKGEPREAVTIVDIATGGGIVLPLRAGVEIPSKPLLMHWMAALLSVAVGSVNEWTVRFPSAMLALLGVLVCYYYVRRLFDARSGLLSALILATTMQYLQAGSGARVDTTLTFFMEVAFFEFLLIAEGLTQRRVLLYVAIAMAVLTKGPVGALLPAAVALSWIALGWRWHVLWNLRLVRGAIIVLLLAGWWYVAASIIGGSAFVHKQILSENVVRFFGGANFHEGHEHRFYYLELALLSGFLPWTPLLTLVLTRAVSHPRKSEPRLSYLLIWFAVVLIFYSLSHSKRAVYLLSLYPALATITALYIVDAIEHPPSSARLIGFLATVYGTVVSLAAIFAAVGLALLWRWPASLAAVFGFFGIEDPEFVNMLRSATNSQLLLTLVIPTAALALGVYLAMSAKTAEKMTLAIGAGMALMAIAASTVVVPAIAHTLSLKQFTAAALKAVGDDQVAYLGDMDYDMAFYSRRIIPIVKSKDPDKPVYLLCWKEIWTRLSAAQRAQYDVVITSNPTDLDGSGRMLLLKRSTEPIPTASPATNV